MASLQLVPTLLLVGNYNAAASGLSSTQDSINNGQNGLNITLPQFSYGTATTFAGGALLINDWYVSTKTITAGSTATIDLSNGSDKNPFGSSLGFSAIKLAIVNLHSPDGAAKFRVGPQGVSNACQLWFGDVTAPCYDEDYFALVKFGGGSGWTVTDSTGDLFCIKNPGASSIIVDVIIGGVK